MTKKLKPLLEPRSIAIIGASNDAGRIGGMCIEQLRLFSYAGEVYPINPKYQEVFGYPCYADIESTPAAPDLVVLAIAAAEVTAMLKRCHQRGVRAVIVYAAGFAEEGEAGLALQRELEAFVAQSGMAVAGPNCMGFANLNTHAYTAFASSFKILGPQSAPGTVAVVTQSGNVCSAVFSLARRQGLNISHFINTGNEACVEYAEYLDYLADDPQTTAVLGYIEQLRNGERFIEAAIKCARQDKALILYKAGETEKGSEAVQSHTSALAGNLAVYRAAFEQLNIIAANDFAQMANIAYLAQYNKRQGGIRIAIVTISGAMGAILADKCIQAGLEVPTLSQVDQQVLRAGIPDYGMVSNPVDVTGNVVNHPEFIRIALKTLGESPDVDVVIVAAPGYLLDRMSEYLIETAATMPRLFVAVDTGQAKGRQLLSDSGVPVFDDITRSIAALAPYCHWMARKQQTLAWADLREQQRAHSPATPTATSPAVTGSLNEYEARQLLCSYGLPSLNERIARDAEHAANMADELGYPVVVKILSRDIPHKTEADGLRLGLTDAGAVRQAVTEVFASAKSRMPQAKLEGVLIQPMLKGVAEMILGVTHDPVFGAVLTAGLGGVLTEIYRDVSHRLLPIDEDIAQTMLVELKAYPLLDGYRGRPKGDQVAVRQAMVALSQAALSQPQLSEIEINPLLVHEAGHSVSAIDALITLD